MQMPTTAYTNSVKSRADLGCDPTGRSSDDDTDYQTAYQSFRTVVVNGGRAWSIASLRAGPPHKLTVDGMEEVKGSSP